MTARNQSPVEPPAPGQSSSTTELNGEVGRLAHLYTVLAEVLRDQLASQLETASTNDLKSVGVLGAALAVVVALLLLRATDPHGIGFWWWYPHGHLQSRGGIPSRSSVMLGSLASCLVAAAMLTER